MAEDQPGTLADAWQLDAGPRRLQHVHETEFRFDDVDLSSAGALAAVHRALVADEARNTQIVDDVTAALGHGRGRNCLVLTRRAHTSKSLPPFCPRAGTTPWCYTAACPPPTDEPP